MNIKRFDELMSAAEGKLGQEPTEWRMFLEFVHNYFMTRLVTMPVVVEIGTMNNAQKPFYVELLGATHIGIDIAGNADIKGDSRSAATAARLSEKLKGRSIDLLFIDGDHTYAGVKSDYQIYGRHVRHLVAVHDINHPYSPAIPEETMRFWKELCDSDKSNVHLSIQKYNSAKTGITANRQMGIGLIIKGAED